MNRYAVIMAGGRGQRLWPLSRRKAPKQMVKLVGGQSLLDMSVNRIKAIFPPENIYIVTNQEYKPVISEQFSEISDDNILGEPAGRDTANAIGLAAGIINAKDPDSAMAVFTADHIISPAEKLQDGVNAAFDFIEANPSVLVTFGIRATSAHTGFGYLKRGDATAEPAIFRVDEFKEKPDAQTAQSYLDSGEYYWNSGMFLWKTETVLDEIARNLPENADGLRRIAGGWFTPERQTLLESIFPTLPKISIDYGIMEKAKHNFMYRLDCRWQDVGSFEALAENVGVVDSDNNTVSAKTMFAGCDAAGNIIINNSPRHLVAAIDIDDLVIVHTDDATLICPKGKTDKLKTLLEKIDKEYK